MNINKNKVIGIFLSMVLIGLLIPQKVYAASNDVTAVDNEDLTITVSVDIDLASSAALYEVQYLTEIQYSEFIEYDDLNDPFDITDLGLTGNTPADLDCASYTNGAPFSDGVPVYIVVSYFQEIPTGGYHYMNYASCQVTPTNRPQPGPGGTSSGDEVKQTKTEVTVEPVSEPVKMVNEVHHNNGSATGSSLDGIYNSSSVRGCVVTTPLSDLNAQVGLTPELQKEGAVLKYFVCDSRPSKTKTLLVETAAQDGYKLAAVINADLYLLNNGTVTPIREVSQKTRMEIGIPANLQKEGRTFFVICFDSKGNKIVMNDLDNDNKSITIDTNVFSLFAICYQD